MNRPGKLLAILNGSMSVWASLVFLVFLRLDVVSWIMVNTCSPAQFATVLGLASERRVLLGATVPWLLFFGFGGLFVFSWSRYMIVAQTSHIIMTVTAVFILASAAKDRRVGALLTGILIGVLALIPFRLLQDQFLSLHPELLRLLGME